MKYIFNITKQEIVHSYPDVTKDDYIYSEIQELGSNSRDIYRIFNEEQKVQWEKMSNKDNKFSMEYKHLFNTRAVVGDTVYYKNGEHKVKYINIYINEEGYSVLYELTHGYHNIPEEALMSKDDYIAYLENKVETLKKTN